MYICHSSCVVVYLPVLHRLPFRFANSVCALTDYQGVVSAISLLEPLVLAVANYLCKVMCYLFSLPFLYLFSLVSLCASRTFLSCCIL